MTSKLKPMALATGARLRHFFLGGEELEFESCSSPEAVKERLFNSSHGMLDVADGARISIWGNRIHIGWSSSLIWRRSTSMFHGIIEPTSSGSRIRGHISAGRLEQLFMGAWFGGLALFSLVFIWTVFIPAAGMIMIWAGSHFVSDKESEPMIVSYLSAICARPAEAD